MKNEMKKTYYTTVGQIRGKCGHKHRSPEAAMRCCRRDTLGCKSQGGYSDRIVIDSDGNQWERNGADEPCIVRFADAAYDAA